MTARDPAGTDVGGGLLRRYCDAMRARVGERADSAIGVVDARMIARYARAIGATDPIHYDADAARAAGFADVVAPPNMITAVVDWGAGAPESELGPDGTAAGTAVPGLRIMGAGDDVRVLRPLVAGTDLVEERVVAEVTLRHGRSGPSAFVTFAHTFRTPAGEVLTENRRTIVVRPLPEDRR
ncbi:FAS1-like dehydratase domain-containing protein [Pseudonocardia adelaidensis]|uniref:FAS1-like dehydratase domain-containing protein n=1 Tax=Pseudonocardia adelaidensis TaxID=648754 RepID=A0ABP9NMV5_9PSEU